MGLLCMQKDLQLPLYRNKIIRFALQRNLSILLV